MNICVYNRHIAPFLWLVMIFLGFIVFPIIFNTKIIPNIEKRLGKKIKFDKNPFYYYFLPKFTHPLFWWGDVASYILYKIFRFNTWKTKYKNTNALAYMEYDIRQSTRFEITMSIIAGLVGLLFILVIGFYAYGRYVYHCS
ncbi:hypothetical protein CbuD7D7780_08745 [Coxiella burnetii]|uniref:Uncharacterized protein n=1 Tax=Coxiella burnetii (strain Dugway 5J108-111) TaxID=434922 RepID=A9KGI0_COXBN|nr:hypothetical protein [Coxiella burnetii]ABS77316.1 hypothetical protein CBUD_1691 [Coxiella burnetii Dugway 5J108-111]OYK79570.1 hypothetical protein CbuD7E6568_08730 [Coxiella burnetii]OYK81652.1 hypothetical protein CbuD7D7780_08745 [Coxiella burnetii]